MFIIIHYSSKLPADEQTPRERITILNSETDRAVTITQLCVTY